MIYSAPQPGSRPRMHPAQQTQTPPPASRAASTIGPDRTTTSIEDHCGDPWSKKVNDLQACLERLQHRDDTPSGSSSPEWDSLNEVDRARAEYFGDRADVGVSIRLAKPGPAARQLMDNLARNLGLKCIGWSQGDKGDVTGYHAMSEDHEFLWMGVPQFQLLIEEDWPNNADQPGKFGRDAGFCAVCDAARDRIMRGRKGYLIPYWSKSARLVDVIYHFRQSISIKALVRGKLIGVQRRTSRTWTGDGLLFALLSSLSMNSRKRPSARLAEVMNHFRRTTVTNTMMRGRLTEIQSRTSRD